MLAESWRTSENGSAILSLVLEYALLTAAIDHRSRCMPHRQCLTLAPAGTAGQQQATKGEYLPSGENTAGRFMLSPVNWGRMRNASFLITGSRRYTFGERWPSGLRRRFAKPLYGQKLYPGFKSLPLRQLPLSQALTSYWIVVRPADELSLSVPTVSDCIWPDSAIRFSSIVIALRMSSAAVLM